MEYRSYSTLQCSDLKFLKLLLPHQSSSHSNSKPPKSLELLPTPPPPYSQNHTAPLQIYCRHLLRPLLSSLNFVISSPAQSPASTLHHYRLLLKPSPSSASATVVPLPPSATQPLDLQLPFPSSSRSITTAPSLILQQPHLHLQTLSLLHLLSLTAGIVPLADNPLDLRY